MTTAPRSPSTQLTSSWFRWRPSTTKTAPSVLANTSSWALATSTRSLRRNSPSSTRRPLREDPFHGRTPSQHRGAQHLSWSTQLRGSDIRNKSRIS
ncbi:MAG: hypothetical protein [Microviridae sp.]|nr:MAG: hypothetical protein [Microviridae sp.]